MTEQNEHKAAQAYVKSEVANVAAVDTSVDSTQSELLLAGSALSRAQLSIRHLVKQYNNAETAVLSNVSLEVAPGKVLVVLGPSGSGKSTLLRTIAGLEPIQGGEIALGNDIIADANKTVKRSISGPNHSSARVGMVFQSYDLFPNKTVLGNITLAPVLVQKKPIKQVREEAIELLRRVGLESKKDAWPHELSGGQRQRVAICRALIMHPEILLFDEVTAALDPEMVREVLDVIVELANQGLTMMIVTHEMAFARAIADRVVLLDAGKIVEESDSPEEFFESPRTLRAQQFLQTFTYSRNRDGV